MTFEDLVIYIAFEASLCFFLSCCVVLFSILSASLDCNKNVDIKFSVHDTFLEYPLSGTLKSEILENQTIVKYLAAMESKRTHIDNYYL